MVRKTISGVQSHYKRYCGVFDDDDGFPGNVSAKVVEDLGDVLSQEGLWKTGGWYFFSPMIVPSSLCLYSGLQRLS